MDKVIAMLNEKPNVIFEIFQRTRPFAISAKLERIIVTILFVTAQALMGTGAVLMQV